MWPWHHLWSFEVAYLYLGSLEDFRLNVLSACLGSQGRWLTYIVGPLHLSTLGHKVHIQISFLCLLSWVSRCGYVFHFLIKLDEAIWDLFSTMVSFWGIWSIEFASFDARCGPWDRGTYRDIVEYCMNLAKCELCLTRRENRFPQRRRPLNSPGNGPNQRSDSGALSCEDIPYAWHIRGAPSNITNNWQRQLHKRSTKDHDSDVNDHIESINLDGLFFWREGAMRFFLPEPHKLTVVKCFVLECVGCFIYPQLPPQLPPKIPELVPHPSLTQNGLNLPINSVCRRLQQVTISWVSRHAAISSRLLCMWPCSKVDGARKTYTGKRLSKQGRRQEYDYLIRYVHLYAFPLQRLTNLQNSMWCRFWPYSKVELSTNQKRKCEKLSTQVGAA